MATLMIDSCVSVIKLAWLQVNTKIDSGEKNDRNQFEAALYDFILKHERAEEMAKLYMDMRTKLLKAGITSKFAVAHELGWRISVND